MKLIKLISIPTLVLAAFNDQCPQDSLGPNSTGEVFAFFARYWKNKKLYWKKLNSLWGQSERCEAKCGDAFVDCVIGCQADSECQSNCNRDFATCKYV